MTSDLKSSYDQTVKQADEFRNALRDQLAKLLEQHSLRPPIPIESRTKQWSSILVKLDRLSERWNSVDDIWDLIGLRLVFLFPEEAARACSLIDRTFEVEYRRHVGQELAPHEFGYQSVHFTVRLPGEWLSTPTLRMFSRFRAEIQVRTLAQHNWAVASRLLQYNTQEYAPPSVRRSLYRVAALLEVVDYELERVNKNRQAYRKQLAAKSFDQALNVDLLEAILTSRLPESHHLLGDDYAALLTDLAACGIATGIEVIDLIDLHIDQALANDRMARRALEDGDTAYVSYPALLAKGAFYSHVGLVYNMLHLAYGEELRSRKNDVFNSQ